MEIHYTWPSGTGSTLNEAPAIARAVPDVGLAFAPFARDQNLIVYGDANSLLILLPEGACRTVEDLCIRPALPPQDYLETVVALATVTAGSQPMTGTRLGRG